MSNTNNNNRNKNTKSGPNRGSKSKKFKSKKSAEKLIDPQSDRESSNYENPIASRELILQVIHDAGAPPNIDTERRLEMNSPVHHDTLRRRLGAQVLDGQLVCKGP